MMIEKQNVLIFHTFTGVDQKALDFATRTFTNRADVRITLFSCYTPLPEGKPDVSKALGSWPAVIGEAILRNGIATQLREYENKLQEMLQHFVKRGFQEVDYIFRPSSRDEADEIIQAAREGAYDVVILSYRPSKVRSIFAKNIYQKIIVALQGAAVCIIT